MFPNSEVLKLEEKVRIKTKLQNFFCHFFQSPMNGKRILRFVTYFMTAMAVAFCFSRKEVNYSQIMETGKLSFANFSWFDGFLWKTFLRLNILWCMFYNFSFRHWRYFVRVENSTQIILKMLSGQSWLSWSDVILFHCQCVTCLLQSTYNVIRVTFSFPVYPFSVPKEWHEILIEYSRQKAFAKLANYNRVIGRMFWREFEWETCGCGSENFMSYVSSLDL